jgi:ATP-grasp domain-containing protein
MRARKDVLVVCPQERDRRAVRAAGLDGRYGVRYAGPDLDAVDRVDAASILAELEGLPADAVVASKDRSALLGAVLAERRGLPGPAPAAVVRCQHKPTSRRLQQAAVPEATPRFAMLGDDPPPFPPPFFVKPVVGRLSENARRVDSQSELAELPAGPPYSEGWAEIAALAGFPARGAHGYLVEELLTGDEVTLEGFVHGGQVTVIGVTDSVKYEGTNSFERFEYPSRLGPDRLAELRAVAERLLSAVGFDSGMFNLEFVVPAAGPARILEVNGRIASQFASLVLAVHGRSTYDALFALAAGDDPGWSDESPAGVAVSYVMREFEDAFVAGIPDPEDGVEILVKPGSRLAVQGTNDAQSYRLAIFYEAGETREEALEHCRARARELRRRFDLRPLPTAAS